MSVAEALPGSTQCTGHYWPAVGCRLRQASWLSDVGGPLVITLTVTLIGLVIAYMFLRRQLRHDVELRAADRRAQAVNRFGIEMHGIMEAFLSDGNLLSAEFRRSQTLPCWREIRDAERRVSLALGELDPLPELSKVSGRLGQAWNACAEHRLNLQLAGQPLAEDTEQLVMRFQMGRIAAGIREGAEGLIAWDGRGEFPDIDMQRWVEIYGPAVLDEAAWRQHNVNEYMAHIQRLTASKAAAKARRQQP